MLQFQSLEGALSDGILKFGTGHNFSFLEKYITHVKNRLKIDDVAPATNYLMDSLVHVCTLVD